MEMPPKRLIVGLGKSRAKSPLPTEILEDCVPINAVEKPREKIVIRVGMSGAEPTRNNTNNTNQPLPEKLPEPKPKPKPKQYLKGPSMRHCLSAKVYHEWRQRLAEYRTASDDDREPIRLELIEWLQYRMDLLREAQGTLSEGYSLWQMLNLSESRRADVKQWLKRDQLRLVCMERKLQALEASKYASDDSGSAYSSSDSDDWWDRMKSSSSSSSYSSSSSSTTSTSTSTSESS
jgi:hypothetical protein